MKIKFINYFFFLKKKNLQFIMRIFIVLFCTTVFSFSPGDIFSQDTKVVIYEDKIVTIDEIFDLLREQTDHTFIYQEDLFKNTPKVHIKKGIISAYKLVTESVSNKLFNFNLTENNKIIVTKVKPNENVRQQIKVNGIVTDETGAPLPGVTVLIKGTFIGDSTDFDGKYQIDASQGDILIFSFIGMESQSITVGNSNTIDVVLKAGNNELDEVVIIGYGSQKKINLTGAISAVNVAEDIGDRPVANINTMLQGSMAGLSVSTNNSGGEPGSTQFLNIRGAGTLTGNGGQPYILVDGIPYSSEDLNSLNPEDIEDVTVLKDAASSAIYGSKGAFGVILINTKKGRKNTKTRVEYSSSWQFATPTQLPNMSDSYDTALAINQGQLNSGQSPWYTEEKLQKILDYQAGLIED